MSKFFKFVFRAGLLVSSFLCNISFSVFAFVFRTLAYLALDSNEILRVKQINFINRPKID